MEDPTVKYEATKGKPPRTALMKATKPPRPLHLKTSVPDSPS
jgi:hypothetical protein